MNGMAWSASRAPLIITGWRKGRRAVAAAIRSQAQSLEHASHRERGGKGKVLFRHFPVGNACHHGGNSPSALRPRNWRGEPCNPRACCCILIWPLSRNLEPVRPRPGTTMRLTGGFQEPRSAMFWMALDHVPEHTALRFAAGSHKISNDYRAVDFFTKESKKRHQDDAPPQWDQIESETRLLVAPMEPGGLCNSQFSHPS